jgi:hypothetical protein
MADTAPSAHRLAYTARFGAQLFDTYSTVLTTATSAPHLAYAARFRAFNAFPFLLRTTVPRTAPSAHRLESAARFGAQLRVTTVLTTATSALRRRYAARFGAFTAFPFLVLPRCCRRRGPVVAAGLAAPVFDLCLVAHASILVNTTSFSDDFFHFSQSYDLTLVLNPFCWVSRPTSMRTVGTIARTKRTDTMTS